MIQTRIPIALATDENYAMPTAVAMTSILENAAKNTFYDFYILVPAAFSTRISQKIALIKVAYPHCDIHFIDMKDSFSDALMRLRPYNKAYLLPSYAGRDPSCSMENAFILTAISSFALI